MDNVLAYDIGGSAFKGGLVSIEGEMHAVDAVKQKPPVTDQRGYSEKDPREWWKDFRRLTTCLLERPEAKVGRIIGLAISGVTRTQVFLDKDGNSVRPALTWADGRANRQVDRVLAAQADVGRRGKTYGPVNAYHPLPRLLWLKENERDRYDRIRLVLEPKDYLNFRLTGLPAGDWISLSRFLTVAGEMPCRDLLLRLGVTPDIIPPITDPQKHLGNVREGLEFPFNRLCGIPVFVGGMDAWCGSLGIGAIQAGCAYNVSGTSEVFGIVTRKAEESPGLVTLPWTRGLYQIGGPSQAGADCLTWLLKIFGNKKTLLTPEAALGESSKSRRQPEPILFLPYLRGERTPLWEPDARGLFLGMNRRHGRPDFIWSVLEGIAFANRQVLELAKTHASITASEVRITGGASRSDLWCQTKADVLSLPVIRTDSNEAGLLGAAMIALMGLEICSDLEEGQRRLVHVDRIFEPRKNRVDVYDRLYSRWVESQDALLPLSCALTREVRDGLTVSPD